MKHFIQIFTLMVMSISNIYATPFSCSNNAYTFESPTASNYSDVYNIDLSMGNRNYTHKITFGNHINATGYNPKDNYIYGFTHGTKKVIKIDSSFNVTDTGISGLKEYTLGDINKEGIYYLAALNINQELTEITTINLNTNTKSTITLNYPVGVNKITAFDFAFNPIDNELYLISDATNNTNNHLMRIKANGDVEDLGVVINPALGITFNSTFAFFDKFGTLYFISPSENYIYSINISNPNAVSFSAIESQNVTWNTGDGDGARCAYADIIPEYDFGDANTGANTPKHKIDRRIMLGTNIDDDNESLILRSAGSANWDDTHGTTPDDEDGVTSIPILYNNMTTYSLSVKVKNQTGNRAYITAWIDWNNNNNFNSNIEAITTDPIEVDSSDNIQTKQLNFNVPAGLTNGSKKVLRVRVATEKIKKQHAHLDRDDGEIEEYMVEIRDPAKDFGDSSAKTRPYHILNSNLTLGSHIDEEDTGAINYTISSDWDDTHGTTPNDEDGITTAISPVRTIDSTYSIDVKVKNTTGQDAYISAWIDFDGNGIFEDYITNMFFFWTTDKGEAITDYVTVGQTGNTPVTKTLTWDLSDANLVKGKSVLRVRVSTSKVKLHDDVAKYDCMFMGFMCGSAEANYLSKPDGEIEEYSIEIKDPEYDYGDAPTTYGATPRHAITEKLTLGSTVDAESSAKTSNDAQGDDNDGSDDEDAIIGTLPKLLTIDSHYSVDIKVKNEMTKTAFVTAWIDWNNNKTFDVNEVINGNSITVPALSGLTTKTLNWNIPAWITLNKNIKHLLRIRVSTDKLQHWEFNDNRDDGEIEEYLVTVTEPDYDWGDAPSGYGTPKHAINTDLGLGNLIDAELTAKTSSDAKGDDNDGSDDEDAIVTMNKLYTASHDYTTTIKVKNNTASTAFVTAWIDWNGDKIFNGSREVMIDNYITIPASSGVTTKKIDWNIPSSITLHNGDKKLLRVRISTNRLQTWDFDANRDDGEIEEYMIEVEDSKYDFGDAPNGYHTPRHAITNELRFGDKVDHENSAYSSASANGDDTHGTDDEDGMNHPDALLSNDNSYTTNISVTNNTNKTAYITAWIDWNGDKTFNGTKEAITNPIPISANSGQSTKVMSWSIPSWITLTAGEKKLLRVRVSTDKLRDWDFDANRDDGEIEEYMIEIKNPPYDFGDAPNGYATPHHILNPNLTLGSNIDAELSAYSSADLHGDDDHADDEDGILDHVIPKINKQSSTYSISTTYNNNTNSRAWITAWIDFDGDGEFDDTYDAMTDAPIRVNPHRSGSVTLNFNYASVASSLVVGSQKVLRVRISSDKILANQADEDRDDGEIEEYPVIVTEPTGVGLLAEYRFDECVWTGRANEVINSNGVSLHGTAKGDAYTTYDGLVNRAGVFDGDRDYIQLDNSAKTALALEGDVSFSMWIKPRNFNQRQGLIYKDYRREYLIVLEKNRLIRLYHGDRSGYRSVTPSYSSSAKINANSWNHVVLTRDSINKKVTLYLNGAKIASKTYTKTPIKSNRKVYLAGKFGNFDGYMDEVKFYRGVVSDANVTNIYNNELAGKNWDGSTREPTPCYDYGDAPVGYTAPAHNIEEDLTLGSKIDAETGVQHSANANGDDNTDEDDEDANSGIPPINIAESVYSVEFDYTNNKNKKAYITGWIDFNNNKTFEATEANQNGAVSVNANSSGSKELKFDIPTGLIANVNRVLRVRVSTDAIAKNQADQNRSDGEIEEHLVALKEPLPVKLVADYHFDECEWKGVANEVKDSSGNGLDGRAVHDADTLHSGKIDRSGYFDGSGDYVRVNNDSKLQLSSDSSFSLWVKPDLFSLGRQGILFKHYNNEFEIIMEQSGWISFYHGDGRWESIREPSGNRVTKGQWNHIAITRDSIKKILTFYINGNKIGTYQYIKNVTSSSNILKIGSRWHSSTSFKGQIDEVKLFQGTLEDANITSIYNNELAGKNWDGTTRTPSSCTLVDYGDALVTNQPSHGIDLRLMLGDLIDSESSALTNPDTKGDDEDKLDDEDGITTLPTIDVNDISYNANVKVTNHSMNKAFVTAWIDFNNNDIFEPNEANDAVIPISAFQTVTRTLTWSNITPMVGRANRTLRVRLSSTAIAPNEAADNRDDGEIEDYSITVTDLSIDSLRFNVERIDSNSTNIIPDRYNLYTQVAGRDFDYSVLVYDENETALNPRAIDRVTAKIELIDQDNGDAILMSKFVHFGTPAISRVDLTANDDLQLTTATRYAKFRITLPVVNIAGKDRLVQGIANSDAEFNALTTGGTNISYSKDSFAIRPASYRLSIRDSGTQIGDDNSHPTNTSEHELATSYDYELVGLATQYQLDIKVDGYSPSRLTDINSTLIFSGSNSCADREDKSLRYIFDNGTLKSETNTTAKLTFSNPNVGEYRLHIGDNSWSGIDFHTNPNQSGCIAGSSTIPADKREKVGCNISSSLSDEDGVYTPKHYDLNISYKAYDFNLTDFNLEVTPDDKSFLYMNKLSDNPNMGIKISGILYAMAKGYNSKLSNFTDGCAATDVTISIEHNVTSEFGVGEDNKIVDITNNLGLIRNKNGQNIPFQRRVTLNNMLGAVTDSNISNPIIITANNFLDANDGNVTIELLYNLKKDYNTTINPISVHFSTIDANATKLENSSFTPSGSDSLDRNITLYYARVAPDKINYPITYGNTAPITAQTPLTVEIFCATKERTETNIKYCADTIDNNGVKNARTVNGWYTSINHNGATDGGVENFNITPSTNVAISPDPIPNFVEGRIPNLSTTYGVIPTHATTIQVDVNVTTWLMYPTSPYSGETIFWNSIFDNNQTGSWSGTGERGNVIDITPNLNPPNRIDW